jgi:hypothetical protein
MIEMIGIDLAHGERSIEMRGDRDDKDYGRDS